MTHDMTHMRDMTDITRDMSMTDIYNYESYFPFALLFVKIN